MQYTEHDVSRDRDAATEMVNLTGQMGVPVITIDGQAVIGFDRQRIWQLISAGTARKRPKLGMKVADANTAARKAGEPPVFGAVVGSIKPSSPGDRAGIHVGDIITVIGQKRINNVVDLEEALAGFSSSGRVPITYYRGDTPHKSVLVFN